MKFVDRRPFTDPQEKITICLILVNEPEANFRFHAQDHLISRERPMEAEKNPFEAVRAMMLENLDKVQSATQSYIDTVEKAMRGFPGANEDQITTFKAYLERKVAANRDFVEKLLRAKDFQEAVRIEVEYFQSQLKAAAEDATQIGAKMAASFKPSTD